MRNLKLMIVLTAIIAISCSTDNTVSEETFNLFPVKVGYEYSFRDINGKTIPGNSYEYLSFLQNGISVGYVDKELDRGENIDFLNTSGHVLFNIDVMDFDIGNSEIWIAKPNEALQLLKKNGEVIFTASKDIISVRSFQNGLAAAEFWDSDNRETLWGFIDQSGQTVIRPQFSDLAINSYFNDGSCPVSNEEGNYGYIDVESRLIIPYQFDYAEPFFGDLAIFGRSTKGDLKFGLINKEGLYVISPSYYKIHRDGKLYMVRDDNGWGWIDRDGNVLIAPQFDQALPFNNSKFASVKIGDDYGFIDKKGKIVVNPQYQYVTSFYNGKALIQDQNGLTGVMSDDLEIDLIPQFEVELPYSSTNEYFRFVETHGYDRPETESDYFEIEAVLNIVKEHLSNKNFFSKSFGQLSSIYGIELDVDQKYHSLGDTSLFSLGDDRSIVSQVYLFGQPSELVDKIKGEGFYQRRVRELELRPDFKPKGIIIEITVSPNERVMEVEQLIINYLHLIGAEDSWNNDVDSGFETNSKYRTLRNEEFIYEIFQHNNRQYLAIYI